MSQCRINNIQLLRAIGALAVVFLHTMSAEVKYAHGERLLGDVFLFGSLGIELFFVISGVAMVMAARSVERGFSTSVRFIYNRATRIYPLYWFFSLPAAAIFLLRPELVNTRFGGDVNLLKSFLLIPQDVAPVLSIGWTLVYQMYFYIVFAIFVYMPERFRPLLVLFWAAMVWGGNVAWACFEPLRSVSVITLVTDPLAFYFMIGCFVGWILRSGTTRFGKCAIILGLCCLPVACLLREAMTPRIVMRSSLFVLPVAVCFALIVYGAAANEMASEKSRIKPLQFIGDASYSIYLSNALVIWGLGMVWQKTARPGLLDNFVWVGLMISMALIIGVMSSRYIERPLLKLTKHFALKRATGTNSG